ncbi:MULTISPECIES: hypothetical protein [Phyllobacterium]|jgi:hypothetical protein|uniref:Uncharacterized protein n=1 Tax=Phyllobacterium sophorae TaxID=1520277 RepID=A0A2P7BIX6_9HYPH|nr:MULTISPECIES: hypothetical protein [Phyllobacterium]PSH66388.1 hypothetical protein CU103_07480 [Phyllobacterium sophorae]UXN64067.1 hypothetical protein N8E89_16685 [Phyllobacterium sp. A18/5-2]
MILGHNPIAWALAVTQLTAAPAGVPRNPERPMNPSSCKEALDRVEEAAEGSPLISSERNKMLLREAIKKAKQQCLTSPPK